MSKNNFHRISISSFTYLKIKSYEQQSVIKRLKFRLFLLPKVREPKAQKGS